MAHDLNAITEVGQADALRGLTQDDCTYRSPARRAAWMRGWHQGAQILQDTADKVAITEGGRESHRGNLAKLRAILDPATR